MKRCKRCIMPDTAGSITFNKDGICSICQAYEENETLGEEALKEIVTAAKERKNIYDCIVPVSGGRDSTFILYTAVRVYGLKVLAVTYDQGFKTELSVDNIRRACNILGADWEIFHSKRNLAEKMIRYDIRTTIPDGPIACAGSFCGICAHGCRSVVYRAADKYKVPLIMWGQTEVESTTVPEKIISNSNGQKHNRSHKLLNMSAYKNKFNILLHRLEFRVPGNRVLSRKKPALKDDSITEIALFDYIKWDRKKIKDTIINELGWEKPAGSPTTWRTDCELVPFVMYGYYKHFGCTKACFGWSNMINSGQMTREEALQQEEALIASFNGTNPDFLRLLKKIGLSKQEISAIEAF